jgi:hypothetical protein
MKKLRTVHVVKTRPYSRSPIATRQGYGGAVYFHQKRDAIEHARVSGDVYGGTKQIPHRSMMGDWSHGIVIYGTELRPAQRRVKRTGHSRSR